MGKYIKLFVTDKSSKLVDDLINTVINEGRVKLHKFMPRGRELWTVVGRTGDNLIFPHDDYCSCNGFYFSLMMKNMSICYHIRSLKIAKNKKKYSCIEISDYDYYTFFKLLNQSIQRQLEND